MAWSAQLGGIQPEVARTWFGMVGPGGQVTSQNSRGNNNGQGTSIAFSDHTDIRPTMMALFKLQDDCNYDGRVLIEAPDPAVLPPSVNDSLDILVQLGPALCIPTLMPLRRHSSSVGAVCVDALVRICAGSDQRWSSLPRQ